MRAEREIKIVNLLKTKGTVHLSELSALLAVSENTIRRDLQHLQDMGMLRRTHGGAILDGDSAGSHGVDDVGWLARQRFLPAEKERIGRKAAELVHNGEAIILDAGTTTMQIARQLHGKHELTVVTNAVNIGLELARSEAITVVLAGGILRELSKSLVGPQAEEFLSRDIHVDKLFLSAGGVSAEAGVTNANTVEIPIKRAMMRSAREVILVVTHDKIGKRSFGQIAPLSAVHVIVTDSGVDMDAVASLESAGVKVLLA